MTENERDKQRKSIDKYGKQLVESNPFIKKDDYNTERDSTTILKQKKYLINLLGRKKYQNQAKTLIMVI